MNSKRLLGLLLVVILLLSACQLPNPGSKVTQQVEGYPLPGQTSPTSAVAYPEALQSNALYPNYKDGDKIEWFQAVAIINNGEVSKLVQAHSLQVTLSLKDGRTLLTEEPAIDDVLKVIEACGDPCKGIQIATE